MNYIYIKLKEYTDIFNEYDYNEFSKRRLSDELDMFFQQELMDSRVGEELSLLINIPLDKKDLLLEEDIEKAIRLFYKDKLALKNKIRILGFKRIFYYIVVALILFSLWYYIQINIGDNLVTAALNIGATVVLWQMMTLIFIERKNENIDINIIKKLYNMKIKFKYI